MRHSFRAFSRRSALWMLWGFFSLVKIVLVSLLLTAGVLVAGQSSVAPVSMQLLTSYGMEYAVATLKPYRHFFPEPYLVNLETN